MNKNIWEIEELLGLKKIYSTYHTGGFYYEGTMVSGDFKGVDDYGRGIISLKISQHIKSPETKILITTIDDGVWAAYSSKIFTPETIELLAQKIIKKYGIKLPSEDEFNKFLNEYGINGTFTG